MPHLTWELFDCYESSSIRGYQFVDQRPRNFISADSSIYSLLNPTLIARCGELFLYLFYLNLALASSQ
jgi:hypothetical protein